VRQQEDARLVAHVTSAGHRSCLSGSGSDVTSLSEKMRPSRTPELTSQEPVAPSSRIGPRTTAGSDTRSRTPARPEAEGRSQTGAQQPALEDAGSGGGRILERPLAMAHRSSVGRWRPRRGLGGPDDDARRPRVVAPATEPRVQQEEAFTLRPVGWVTSRAAPRNGLSPGGA
jgi:hypothetical protein